MQKEKKVHIELPALNGSKTADPVKSPASNRFKLVPASATQLKELVLNVSWNSTDQKLHIKAVENYHFDVYRWVESIKKTYAESQKGPFVDLEQDAILLHFMDHLGHEVATFKFKELKLIEHKVDLSYTKIGNLVHDIQIQYKDVEKLDTSELVDWSTRNDVSNNEEADEEWLSVGDSL